MFCEHIFAIFVGVAFCNIVGKHEQCLLNFTLNVVFVLQTCPRQPWLDGINSGDGYIRQFVAMKLGEGYTVEKQVSLSTLPKGFVPSVLRVFECRPSLFGGV